MNCLLFSLLCRNFDCCQIPENPTLTNHSLAGFCLQDKALHKPWYFLRALFSLQWAAYCFKYILHSFDSCHQWEAPRIPGAKLHPSLGWLNSWGSEQKKQPCANQQSGLQRPSLGLGSQRTALLLGAGHKSLLMSFEFMLQKSKSSNFTLWLFSWIPMLSQTQRFAADEEFSHVSPGSCKRFQKEDLSRL